MLRGMLMILLPSNGVSRLCLATGLVVTIRRDLAAWTETTT